MKHSDKLTCSLNIGGYKLKRKKNYPNIRFFDVVHSNYLLCNYIYWLYYIAGGKSSVNDFFTETILNTILTMYSHFSILLAIEPPSWSCKRLITSVTIFPTEAVLNAMLTMVAMLAVFVHSAAQNVAPPTLWAMVAVGTILAPS